MSEISFTREQAMLADIAVKFFRDRWPIESAREQLLTDTGYDRGLWQEMVDAGWAGVAIPERWGGTGLGPAELVVLVEPMGRHLLASPFLSTQLVIQALLGGGSEEQRESWLPRLAEGAAATMATVEPDGDWTLERCSSQAERGEAGGLTLSGEKCFVLDAEVADVILVTVSLEGRPALAFVDSGQLPSGALERETVIDETRRSFRLRLDGIEIDQSSAIVGDDAAAALVAIRHAALLLISAEACGGIAGALDVVVEYLKSRRQFGHPIGSYQALKHPTVDILVGLERSRSHLYHAATVFSQPQAEVALRMAKAESSESFAFAGDRAVQFHGGFGFTYECDAQLFLRRALWCQYQFGDPLHQRKRLAELML